MKNSRKKARLQTAPPREIKVKVEVVEAQPPYVWAWIYAAGLIACTMALYFPALHFTFSELDDMVLIVEDQAFLGNLRHMPEILGRPFFAQGWRDLAPYFRPLITLSFMLESQIQPLQAAVFHATNIFVHIVNVLLLWILLRNGKKAQTPAFIAALLFALHPMSLHAVAWVPGRCDLFLTTGCLVAAMTLHRWWQTKSVLALVGYAGGCLLAIASKETAIMILPLSLLWIYTQSRSWSTLRPVLGVWVVVGASFGTYWLEASHRLSPGGPRVWTMLKDGLSMSHILLSNFFKLSLPLFPAIVEDFDSLPAWYFPAGAAALAGIAVLLHRSRYTVGFLVVLSLFAFQLPGLLGSRSHLLENRLYLPALLFCVLIAFSFEALLATKNRWKWALFAGIGVLYFVQSHLYLARFASVATFIESAYQTAPNNPTIVGNYALNLMQQNRLDEAEKVMVPAVARWPDQTIIRHNLGTLYMRSNRLPEALAVFKMVIDRDASYWQSFRNIIIILALEKNLQELPRYMEGLARTNPQQLEGLNEVVDSFASRGQRETADFMRAQIEALRARFKR